jgi:hypothetical protein
MNKKGKIPQEMEFFFRLGAKDSVSHLGVRTLTKTPS